MTWEADGDDVLGGELYTAVLPSVLKYVMTTYLHIDLDLNAYVFSAQITLDRILKSLIFKHVFFPKTRLVQISSVALWLMMHT